MQDNAIYVQILNFSKVNNLQKIIVWPTVALMTQLIDLP